MNPELDHTPESLYGESMARATSNMGRNSLGKSGWLDPSRFSFCRGDRPDQGKSPKFSTQASVSCVNVAGSTMCLRSYVLPTAN